MAKPILVGKLQLLQKEEIRGSASLPVRMTEIQSLSVQLVFAYSIGASVRSSIALLVWDLPLVAWIGRAAICGLQYELVSEKCRSGCGSAALAVFSLGAEHEQRLAAEPAQRSEHSVKSTERYLQALGLNEIQEDRFSLIRQSLEGGSKAAIDWTATLRRLD